MLEPLRPLDTYSGPASICGAVDVVTGMAALHNSAVPVNVSVLRNTPRPGSRTDCVPLPIYCDGIGPIDVGLKQNGNNFKGGGMRSPPSQASSTSWAPRDCGCIAGQLRPESSERPRSITRVRLHGNTSPPSFHRYAGNPSPMCGGQVVGNRGQTT